MDMGELKNHYFMEMSFRFAEKVHGRRASALGFRVRVFKA
jgi:hypothetical protein